ncbi:hypothetical protein AVEN_34666-1 [Araneus ventricosus]|uniref:Uncharacterized protein n=1 Tax=Araneus ventricosus TaxID=182803 RepID=A0A4Y2AZI8_ARAVE|nr:hypothetical protein AVEN_34666-1 [Araneus ventricosus]
MLPYPFIPFSNLTTHTPRPHRGGAPPLRLFPHCPLAFSLPRTRTSSEDFSRSDGPRKIRVRTLSGRRSPATRGLYWELPRNSKPWSDYEDDTCASTPLPILNTASMGGDDGRLVESGLSSRPH